MRLSLAQFAMNFQEFILDTTMWGHIPLCLYFGMVAYLGETYFNIDLLFEKNLIFCDIFIQSSKYSNTSPNRGAPAYEHELVRLHPSGNERFTVKTKGEL